MRRSRAPLSLSLLGAVLALCTGCPPERPSTKVVAPSGGAKANDALPECLSIGAWNDLHGQITPDDPVIDTGRAPAGGVIALADRIADLRATGDTVVLLDAGDLFTGPLESTMAEGAPIIDAYRLLGVDAATIGNHEFDFGPVGYGAVTAKDGTGDEANAQGPRGALLANMEHASFPFVSANIHVRATGKSPAWPKFSPSTRIVRGRFNVGVVGYSTEVTPKTTLKANVADLDFSTDAAASVAREIRALRAAGAAPVVLLAHASIEGILPQRLDDPSDPDGKKREGEIASLVAKLGDDRPDVIVAGHRHAWLLGRVSGIPIVSSDQHGVGIARIRFCQENGTTLFRSIERNVVMASETPRTELGKAVAKAMDPWLSTVKEKAEALVTTLPETCAEQSPDGTALAEQIARAIAERVADAAPAPRGVPVVGLTNSGGVRAPLKAGPLRYADLFATFPFENAVSVCETTQAGVEKLVQNALKRPSSVQRFPFGIAGAKVTVDRSAKGELSLARLDVEGSSGKPDAPVWLALPDFVLDGGDGLLDGVSCTKTARSSTRVRDAWRNVLEREHGGCSGAPKNVRVHAR